MVASPSPAPSTPPASSPPSSTPTSPAPLPLHPHLARPPDCQLLSALNIDYLSNAGASLGANQTLVDAQADRVQTLLSALITNQQTCLDGLLETGAARRVTDWLSVPLANDTKLYSVGLSLVTRAWVPRRARRARGRGRFHRGVDMLGVIIGNVSDHQNGRRRLLQSSDSVVISDIVVVSQDGTGNFTTISDALDAAPNNTKVDDGYYLIYVTAGVYEEYVTVTKKKKYVMMIGDGINQTVITGNRSMGDGWPTFNTATVGEGHLDLDRFCFDSLLFVYSQHHVHALVHSLKDALLPFIAPQSFK
ncbi:putative pectinesterase/pectinesterase inhibitor 20 [Acorus calamus]|uniref:Pectinesterase/pectinesterase inhibitor 20 n=1 Tax=Acorus calamus TaxID=4465 RepID=A0AAV9CUZ5_ACOCL|nr:putative pectinesterase/pectinesterase inhibitor 20 [Acorus calamus]